MAENLPVLENTCQSFRCLAYSGYLPLESDSGEHALNHAMTYWC